MSHADDVGNLFLRFGASADSYKEMNTEFDFLEPLQTDPTPGTGVLIKPAVIVQPAAPVPLPPPAAPAPESLRERLLAVACERQALAAQDMPAASNGPARPHVIVVLSAKGGVGKTTLAASLGKLLKRQQGRTLLLDLDPQNALLSHFNLARSTPGLNQARLQGQRWNSVCAGTQAGVECLPFGPSNTADLREFDALVNDDSTWLANHLASLALGRHDLLIIDTPTGASVWLQQALSLADQVFAVTQADAASHLVLDKLQSWLSLRRPDTCAYVVNKVDPRNPLNLDMNELLRRQLGHQWLAAIPLDAQLDHALAFEYDPFLQPADSPACQALRVIASSFAHRIEPHREDRLGS